MLTLHIPTAQTCVQQLFNNGCGFCPPGVLQETVGIAVVRWMSEETCDDLQVTGRVPISGLMRLCAHTVTAVVKVRMFWVSGVCFLNAALPAACPFQRHARAQLEFTCHLCFSSDMGILLGSCHFQASQYVVQEHIRKTRFVPQNMRM